MSTRRRNKSNKIPNVKLRPADAAAVAASKARLAHNAISTAWALDSDGDELEGDSGVLDPCPRPLKGLIVCATGLADKTSLFKKAVELGAVALQDLTDKVTHLIADECGSAKYRCALERKIPIMQPSWILECHSTWLKGDDVDLDAMTAEHRLPIFAGVTVCVSGLDDVAQRTRMSKLVAAQGGAYAKALERPVRVTHLLCAGAGETDKMRYASKFNAAGEARIAVVWAEWFWDCVEYGGRFAEDAYAVSLPRPERKSGGPALPLPQPSSAPLSSTCLTPTPPPPAEEDELVSVRRVPADTLQVWASVLRPRGFVVAGGRLQRSPSKSASQGGPATSPCPLPTRARTLQDLGTKPSALAGLSRAGSFAPAAKDASTPRAPNLFARAASRAAPSEDGSFFAGIRAREAAEAEAAAAPENAEAGPSRVRAVFAGLRLQACGEAACESVVRAIEGAGGMVLPEDSDEEPDFIVVRLLSGSALFQAEPDAARRAKYRTECWLERCVFAGEVCGADAHPAFVPLPTSAGGACGGALLSVSGLEQAELCWTRRLARARGVPVAPAFSRRSTHLLCPSGAGAKFDKAREWGVPVVGTAWLAEVARTGMIPPPGHFLVGSGGVALPVPEPEVETAPELEDVADAQVFPEPEPEPEPSMHFGVHHGSKGKGKAAPEAGISDITNASSSRSVSRELPARQSLARLLTPDDEDDEPAWPFGAPGPLLSLPRTPEDAPPPPASSQPASVAATEDDEDGDFEAQRALQQSLANLLVLGKRATDSDADSPERARPGKRSKPLAKAKTTALAPDLVRASPPSFATYEGTSLSLSGRHPVEQRERYAPVMHEDPVQRREQAKLLGLLGKAPPSAGRAGPRPRPVKKGARKPGF